MITQAKQVNAQIVIAEKAGRQIGTGAKVIVYENYKGNKLITYWDAIGLQRILVDMGANIKLMGDGPVDIKEWMPLDNAEKLRQESRKWCNIAQQSEGGKGLAVGCRGIDHQWRSSILTEMARSIDAGISMIEVITKARKTGKEWIEAHNKQRPKDFNWKRDIGCLDSFIDATQRKYSLVRSHQE